MILVILTALAAVCGAAKLDQSYLPPITAKSAGGSPGVLQTPFDGSNQGSGGLPIGSYTNDVQGVVVDAVNPGTRTSGNEPTGLGGPRPSYGSKDSKVGDAAFTSFGNPGGISTRIAPGFESFIGAGDPQADKTRASTLKFSNDVGLDNYSYGFETDNGISVGENGVAANGVQAQGGYSYKGDDGKTYSVTYTADKDGYNPKGPHLPTPPPIPNEILESLEKNAKEEAAGLVDDGSYDPKKYNDEGDYSSNSASNNNVRPVIGGGDATASGSFVSQNNQAYKPTSGVLIGSYNPGSDVQGQTAQDFSQVSSNKQSSLSQFKGSVFSGSSSLQPHAHAQASVSGSPVGTPSFPKHSLPGSSNVNSAYSSAITTGSGSASAFASTSSTGSELKKDYSLDNFGSSGHFTEGFKSVSDSSAGASFPGIAADKPNIPSTASASAVVSGSPTFGINSQQHSGPQHALPSSNSQHSGGLDNEYLAPVNRLGSNGKETYDSNAQGTDTLTGVVMPDFQTHSQSPNIPSSSFASASVSGNQGTQLAQNTNYPSRFGGTQTSQLTSSGSSFVKPLGSSSSFANSNEYQPSVDIIESTGKPTYNLKPLGSDSSSASSADFHQLGHHNLGVPSGASAKPSALGSSSFGLSSQQTGFKSESLNSKPGQYSQTNSGFPSSSGQTQLGSTNTQFSGIKPTQPTLSFGSITSQGPTKLPDTELTTPFESNESVKPTSVFNYQTSNQASGSLGSSNNPLPSPTPVSSFVASSQQGTQSGSTFLSQPTFPSQVASGQYKPQSLQNTLTDAADAAVASSTPQPALNQQQGSDDSYYYQKPFKPFIIPSTTGSASSSSQFLNNRQPNFPVSSSTQQGSKYSNTPSSTGQYQGSTSSSYNGITQAAISPFPSNSPTTSTQFASQSSQFGSKPVQFGQSSLSSQQTSTQFGAIGNQQTFVQKPVIQFSQKPIIQSPSQFVQSSTSQNIVGSQVPTQQYQGTVYEYNKPAETLPAPEHTSSSFKPVTATNSQAKPSQISTDSRFGSQQGTSQFGGQSKPFGSTTSDSSFQSTQISQTSTFGSQFGQKPQNSQGISTTTGSNYQQTQFGSFGQKPQTTQGSSSFTSNTLSQSQQSQFGKKPVSTTQSGTYFQQTQFGSTGSQSSQKLESTQGTGLTSSSGTQSQTSFGQKPFGSSTTSSSLQQSQFGTAGSSFGQKPQTTLGSSFTSNTFSQSQFGKKPTSITQTGSTYQPTQFGSTGSQFGQKPQSTLGTGSTVTTSQPSSGQKPFGTTQIGSTYQQSQFGSISSQFGQKPQSSSTSQTSFGQKHSGGSQTGSPYQQTQFSSIGTQFGQKPQTTTGSAFGSNTVSKGQSVQTSQFGQKPFGSSQAIGSSLQQNQYTSFGSQGVGLTSGVASQSQFGQASLSGQKPFGVSQTGSSFQQTQVGSSGSQYGQKPQSSLGSTFTSNSGSKGQSVQTTQFGQKPFESSQTTVSKFQQNQFASSSGSQLSQGIGSTPATASQSQFGLASQSGQKPFGASQIGSSSVQFGSTGPQFGQKPQSSQGTSFTSNTGSKQTQFTSSFGSQSSQGIGSTSGVISQNQFGPTSQNGKKPFSSSATQFGKQPLSSSQNSLGSTIQQTQLGSTVSQIDQKQQSSQGNVPSLTTVFQTVQPAQFGQKPYSSSTSGSSFQFGTSGTQTAQSPSSNFGSYSQSSQIGTQAKKPFGSSQTPIRTQISSITGQFGQNPQAQASAFASSAGSNIAQFGSQTQKPFGNTQTNLVSKYQQASQFGTESQGPSIGSHTQKPLTQTNYQQSQYSQTSGLLGTPSRFGQGVQSNVGTGLPAGETTFGVQTQKPFGSQSTQTSFQQSQYTQGQKPFGSSQGSAYQIGQSIRPQSDQKTQSSQSSIQTESISSQSAQSSSAQSSDGYNYQKPGTAFGIVSQSGGLSNTPQDQKTQSTQTTFNSQVSQQITGQPIKPFGSSSIQGNFQQTQSNIGTAQFGVQPTLATATLKPVSTPSTQEFGYQSQSPAISTSQFSVQPTKPTIQFSGRPFKPVTSIPDSSVASQNLVGSTLAYGVQPTQSAFITTQRPSQIQFSGEPLNPSGFSTIQPPSIPSRLGSNIDVPVSTVQTAIAQSSFVGQGEVFGGPRDPPRFDDKTGYHY